MFFKRIEIKNFMSFGHEVFDDFSNGLTLIEAKNLDEGGSNGAGKSSLWDAVSWALFNQTVRGIKNDDVIHRKAKKNCSVVLFFEHGGSDYKVSRFRKDDDFGSKILIENISNKKIIEKGTAADTQEFLLNLLGIDFDLFRCTVMFGQDDTFNFVSETDKRQKEIISKIMRVDFDEYRLKIKSQLQNALSRNLELEKQSGILKSHIIENVNKAFSEDISKWEEDRARRSDRIMSLLKDQLKRVEDLERAKVGDFSDTSLVLADLERSLLQVQGAKSKVQAQIAVFESQASKMTGLQSECPTCFQTVEKKRLKDHIDNCRGQIHSLQKALDAILEKELELKTKSSEMRNKVSELKAIELSLKALPELKDSLKKLASEALSIKSETNPFQERLKKEAEKQEQIKKSLQQIESDLVGVAERVQYLTFWENAFGDRGIKSFIFDLICGSLATRSNYYASLLTNGSVVIEFDTQTKLKSGEIREKFEILIVRDGEKIPYESYSGGEKRRISLAVDMALSDIMRDYWSSSFNILVFDEQTNGMDAPGRQCFMKLLKELSKDRFIAVVDHDSEFKTQFDRVWTIQKEGGFSSLISHAGKHLQHRN